MVLIPYMDDPIIRKVDPENVKRTLRSLVPHGEINDLINDPSYKELLDTVNAIASDAVDPIKTSTPPLDPSNPMQFYLTNFKKAFDVAMNSFRSIMEKKLEPCKSGNEDPETIAKCVENQKFVELMLREGIPRVMDEIFSVIDTAFAAAFLFTINTVTDALIHGLFIKYPILGEREHAEKLLKAKAKALRKKEEE
jgi:hypothetical protein